MSASTPFNLTGRTIRCLLFDLGDTLWTRTNNATWRGLEQVSDLRAVATLYKHIPHAARPDTDPLTLGEQLRTTIEEQVRQQLLINIGDEPDFASITVKALQKLGLPRLETAAGGAIFEALRIHAIDSRHLFNDVFTTLEALQERGFILGVVTNRQYGGRPFFQDLEELGLFKYFDRRHIAVSADLQVRKPNPAIFKYALEGLDVAPEEAAMVGDSLRADVYGAKQLNMLAIWKPKMRMRTTAQAELLARYLATQHETTANTEPAHIANPYPELAQKCSSLTSRKRSWKLSCA